MLTVKELKKHLEQFPDEAVCYHTVWTEKGPKNYQMRIPCGDNKLYKSSEEWHKNKTFLLLSWVDDCLMDTIPTDSLTPIPER